MKMESAQVLLERADPSLLANGATQQEIFQQIGAMTRLLHDTMQQLGVMPKLQNAADGLPDARSRLNYIAEKTAAAANKVLNSVDSAKADHQHIATETRRIADAIVADPVRAVASGAVLNFVSDVEQSTARIDAHLTDIMMAQDFQDLTGQVIKKIVALAQELETGLMAALLELAPEAKKTGEVASLMNGPVINAEGRTDVVVNQEQVDDLLDSLGF